ncbi:NAD(P)-binding protein [Rhizobacter sp. AJA081-3]|uniref:NAD(P)/FAD-dependent oxidoreductase n=1 Tax=Rhizobacter sp. AJA081-3 TaxID=2753607 RepID=UPI001ADFED94|nr:NAD(P)-binding protein [Rhizobacter sp. AJA081-3]QTN21252.1 NAD(P)-binding protein [Rhizobacter sp. AJA081-3]
MQTCNEVGHVAVIGAGVAGAVCARDLMLSGCQVQVFDKSRGAGGRLATRRAQWQDAQSQPRSTKFDHGATGFGATTPAFRAFADQACRSGWLTSWTPVTAPGTASAGALYVPIPDMPRLTRELLCGIDFCWDTPIEALHRQGDGWRLRSRGEALPGAFDAVVLAMPPAQSAMLLAPHEPAWAQRAAQVLMQPCWTLMGIAEPPQGAAAWDLARPAHPVIDLLSRNERRPGRERRPDEAHWVAHARADWSREQLEQPGDEVQARMQAAVAECLGEPVRWRHAVVHRWRYAQPGLPLAAPADSCWWDAASGLGVCGDFLGGLGVEGAWQSGAALAGAVLGNTAAREAARGPSAGADDASALRLRSRSIPFAHRNT